MVTVTGARPRVALVHLGREQARGEVRRVGSWVTIFEAAGADVCEVALLPELRAGLADPVRSLPGLMRGDLVPEAAAWSWPALRLRLRAIDPDVVVCVTARAFHPGVAAGPWLTVLDYVDRLSVSYAARARSAGRLGAPAAYRGLAGAARRFENRGRGHGTVRVAAGWRDAERLGAWWVPNVMTVPPGERQGSPRYDLLFFGTLSYAPNIQAVERLDRMWPAIQRRRPGTTLVIAGASPPPLIEGLASRHRWQIDADFESVGAVCASARLAVAPLSFASGIQNKVLEAAAHGLPQVVSEAAAAGLGPGFPVTVAASDEAFVRSVCDLLDDRRALALAGGRARRHVAETYTADRWVAWAADLLDPVGKQAAT